MKLTIQFEGLLSEAIETLNRLNSLEGDCALTIVLTPVESVENRARQVAIAELRREGKPFDVKIKAIKAVRNECAGTDLGTLKAAKEFVESLPELKNRPAD